MSVQMSHLKFFNIHEECAVSAIENTPSAPVCDRSPSSCSNIRYNDKIILSKHIMIDVEGKREEMEAEA